MNEILILNEMFTNGYRPEILNIISLLSIICGIFVIISRNPIVSVLFLIGLFLSVSSYLLLLGINFIGLSYILIYVGAISILFLFILMLINVRVEELSSYTSNNIPLAILIAISFNSSVNQVLPYSNHIIRDKESKSEISFVTSKIWDGNLAENSQIASVGNIMYTSYSIWIIITSIILLLAMIGAIVITINPKKKRN